MIFVIFWLKPRDFHKKSSVNTVRGRIRIYKQKTHRKNQRGAKNAQFLNYFTSYFLKPSNSNDEPIVTDSNHG